jgi:hypothetical protein
MAAGARDRVAIAVAEGGNPGLALHDRLRQTRRCPTTEAWRPRRRAARRKWLLLHAGADRAGLAASGPLLIVLVYSFLTPGNFGGVVWQFSTEGWFRVFFARDIFDPENVSGLEQAHLTIFWRSISLSCRPR